ncbi:hypothetical protein BH09ACT4_BH09ACT4_25220 [soil metagenome]
MRDKQKRKERRNRIFLIGGSTVAIVAIFLVVALVIVNANKPIGPGPANMASDGIVLTGGDSGVTALTSDPIKAGGDPIPTDTTKLDGQLHIVTYVDYRCPFCNEFEQANAATIQQLVDGKIATLEIHPISILDRSSLGTKYSTRAASAAGCVATYAPDSFLTVNTALFTAQPPENTAGLTNDEIVAVVNGAGVTDKKVASCIKNETYTAWVTEATNRALADPALQDANGNFGTPRVVVNGVLYSGAPGDATAFETFLTQAAIAGNGATPTPTPSPTP